MKVFGFVDEIFWISWNFFWICWNFFLDLITKSFGFVDEIIWICRQNLLGLSTKFFEFVGKICQRHYPMTASLHGSHGLSAWRARRTKSRGPKGLQLEVGAQRAPRLLVLNIAFQLSYISRWIKEEARSDVTPKFECCWVIFKLFFL